MTGKNADGHGGVQRICRDGKLVAYQAQWTYVDDGVSKRTSKN